MGRGLSLHNSLSMLSLMPHGVTEERVNCDCNIINQDLNNKLGIL